MKDGQTFINWFNSGDPHLQRHLVFTTEDVLKLSYSAGEAVREIVEPRSIREVMEEVKSFLVKNEDCRDCPMNQAVRFALAYLYSSSTPVRP